MTDATTIKVPRPLRDRLAARAAEAGLPMAAVIERALDARDEQEFWADVQREHAAMTPSERGEYLRSGGADDLADADDDAISDRDEW